MVLGDRKAFELKGKCLFTEEEVAKLRFERNHRTFAIKARQEHRALCTRTPLRLFESKSCPDNKDDFQAILSGSVLMLLAAMPVSH